MPSDVMYKREIAYQIMRTIRAACIPLFFVCLIALGVFLYFNILNGLEILGILLNSISDSTYTRTMFENGATTPGECIYISIWEAFWFGVSLLMTIVCYSIGTPYMSQPNMPTYQIRHCKHCGAALANINILTCHSCGGRFPSGIILFMIRMYGAFISFAIWGTMGIVAIFCI